MIGFGIYGLGMVAEINAQAIAGLQGGRLLAVGTRSPGKGVAFAQRHGVAYAGQTVEALADTPGVQVICVTTSSGAHLEPCLAAIRRGKHVVVEKPIEVTVAR